MKIRKGDVFYYTDELHDDFAPTNTINGKEVGSDYPYLKKDNFFIFSLSFLFRYFLAAPIFFILYHTYYNTKIHNRNVLKKVKRRGYFIYSNHVTSIDPAMHASLINTRKKCIIVSGKDTFSINPIVTHLVKQLGAIPMANAYDKQMNENFSQCLYNNIKKKHRVLLYPEAHIWPFYTGIRRFSYSSFLYPVRSHAPIIVSTTTFKKRRFRKKPKFVIYLDGPFYPNEELSSEYLRAQDLSNKAYNCMLTRSQIPNNYSYCYYRKKENV